MFNFLKDKLKSWVNKVKPEKELSIKKISKKKPKEEKVKEKAKETPVQKKKQTKQERHETQKLGASLSKETNSELAKELYEHEETKHIGVSSDKQKLEQEEEIGEAQKSSFWDRFRTKLDDDKFNELFEELEMSLLQNNVALEVVDAIKKNMKEQLIGKNIKDIDLLKSIKQAIESVLLDSPDFIKEIKTSLTQKQPFVIAFVGINGSGKTTTIAKVVNLLKKNKLSVCLAAADTFRAAAIQQLEEHASRLGVPIIKKDYGTDPASVGFDAISYAKKHHIDIVLIDTAGRMNTKDSLMKEMEKIIKVCKPDMKIFIGESITGNDATEQAKSFNESIDLTGMILSKADVDEKGGTALSVSYITKKPILFLGTGQSYDDLEKFNKNKILERLGLG